MCRYSETVIAEVRRRMGTPQRKSVAQISQQFGIHVAPSAAGDSLAFAWGSGAGIRSAG